MFVGAQACVHRILYLLFTYSDKIFAVVLVQSVQLIRVEVDIKTLTAFALLMLKITAVAMSSAVKSNS